MSDGKTKPRPLGPLPTLTGASAGGLSQGAAPQEIRPYAAGYSRFVNLSKMILPAIALLLIVLVIMWPYLKVKDTRFRLGFSSISVGEAGAPSMVNPRFFSADKDSQAFSVTADIAKNMLGGKSTVQLEMPKADISLDDGTWLVMTAETGVFGRAEKALDLAGSVNLFHDSGFEFNTDKARIDLDKGIAYGENPIRGQGPFGEIEGEGFLFNKKSKSILFTGKSRVLIFPGIGKQAQ